MGEQPLSIKAVLKVSTCQWKKINRHFSATVKFRVIISCAKSSVRGTLRNFNVVEYFGTATICGAVKKEIYINRHHLFDFLTTYLAVNTGKNLCRNFRWPGILSNFKAFCNFTPRWRRELFDTFSQLAKIRRKYENCLF